MPLESQEGRRDAGGGEIAAVEMAEERIRVGAVNVGVHSRPWRYVGRATSVPL